MFLILFFVASIYPQTNLTIQTGSVSGKISLPQKAFTKEIRRKRNRRYKRRDQELLKKARKYNEYEKTMVYLKPLNDKNKRFIRKEGMLNQLSANFEPAHVVIQAGNDIVFVNQDNIFHNVFSSCCVRSFNIGKRRQGVKVRETFEKTGHMQVFCDIHAQMTALISVVDSPYYTVCDAEGRFDISDIPPGDYKVIGWHPKAEYESGTISIKENQFLKVKLEFE